MSAVLRTEALGKRFGGLVATNDVSLSLEKGARHALIGPNGAGKTTLVNLLTGVLSASSGAIRLDGEDITRLKQDERVRRGLARTFQINQLFADLTPLETLCLAISKRDRGGGRWWSPLFGDAGIVREASEILDRFLLSDVAGRRAGDLAYGRQRLLEIATAVALRPRVLLLDEPAAGVPEDERHAILGIVKALPADVTILLIEHDMDLVLNPRLLLLDEPLEGLAPVIADELLRALSRIVEGEGLSAIIVEQKARKILKLADQAIVLDRGAIVERGTAAAFLAAPSILERHLGVAHPKRPITPPMREGEGRPWHS